MIKRFIYIALLFTFSQAQQYKITHMEGTYDLDGDGFMEFVSVESKTNENNKYSVVRYYELDDNGYQQLEWELEAPDGLLSNFVDVELKDKDIAQNIVHALRERKIYIRGRWTFPYSTGISITGAPGNIMREFYVEFHNVYQTKSSQ